MLKLVKLKKEFSEQLIDMMDEWTMANEKIYSMVDTQM